MVAFLFGKTMLNRVTVVLLDCTADFVQIFLEVANVEVVLILGPFHAFIIQYLSIQPSDLIEGCRHTGFLMFDASNVPKQGCAQST